MFPGLFTWTGDGEKRDIVRENMLLFVRKGVEVRSFYKGMRGGGRRVDGVYYAGKCDCECAVKEANKW